MMWLSGSRGGQVITCTGSWTSANTVYIFRSALQKLHKNNPITRGTYIEPCDDCLACPNNGCTVHRGNAQIRLQGNVCSDPKLVEAIKCMNKYIKDWYVVRATCPLLPNEIQQIRAYLISMNQLDYLMIWVMIMFAITQGLRVDEVITLTYEQFLQRYFDVDESSHVDSLLFTVNGKCDENDVHLLCWDDHYCPEFSSLRLILLWVRLAKIKSGF